ncbi:hypothetical protein HS7_17700 [Sulfolobales archaeon HS-7]|nr:hypothetical protein HS7_17700 [Sulfolobales archaeon HS-7]
MSLRELKDKKCIIWASYFNSTKSKGLRMKKIPNLKVEEIIRAGTELGLEPVQLNKAYPKNIQDNIAIVVKKVDSKRKTLNLIYKKVLELRRVT